MRHRHLLVWLSACVLAHLPGALLAPVDNSALGLTGNKAYSQGQHKPVALLLPSSSHTKLNLQQEGLDYLRSIKTPVAAVVVAGPYRSGKSFLLNQLLHLPCSSGFGVGHQREAQTKGVWVWGEPFVVDMDGRKVSLLFIDTEGFEGTGQADVYDDRIFALSVLVSSTLVYNLPETVKESDIAKLSFAAQLAQEFYKRQQGRTTHFELTSLLWLIQRDFLEGKTVKEVVRQALSQVPNPSGDKHIAALNSVRTALQEMDRTNEAFGLKQPHLQRTRLCDLPESSFDPQYLQQRDELRQMVQHLTKPKKAGGKELDGASFADFFQKAVEAINTGEIPTPTSVIDSFNANVMEASLQLYKDAFAEIALPETEEALQHEQQRAVELAIQHLHKQSFGGAVPEAELEKKMADLFQTIQERNQLRSKELCEQLQISCSESLEQVIEGMRLPSRNKFSMIFERCNSTYEEHCIGPSKEMYRERLHKSFNREMTSFMKDYNHKLLNGLTTFSLASILICRFILKSGFLELASWVAFIMLEVSPKLSMFDVDITKRTWWSYVVMIYENIVYNPVIDLDGNASVVICGLVLLSLYIKYKNRPKEKKSTD